jgi:hypothetical protein
VSGASVSKPLIEPCPAACSVVIFTPPLSDCQQESFAIFNPSRVS